jgi:predicted RNase H-like HicB family nuclease
VVPDGSGSCIMNQVRARNSQPKGVGVMQVVNMVVERDPDTGLYVGYVPGWPGAHTQGASRDELLANLREVVLMLLEDGAPKLESEFIGVQTLRVA